MLPKERVAKALKRFVDEIAAIDKEFPWNNGHEPDYWSPMMNCRTMAYKVWRKIKSEPS